MKDLEWTSYRAKQKRKLNSKNKRKVSMDSFSITTSTNNGIPTDGSCQANGYNIGINIVETMAEEDPHLFSSLINLPTFADNGEKVINTVSITINVTYLPSLLTFVEFRFQLEFLKGFQKIEIFMMFCCTTIHIYSE